MAARNPRPPLGAGYLYPSYRGQRKPTMMEKFGGLGARPLQPNDQELGFGISPREGRLARIKVLEQGLREHDVQRSQRLAEGTEPVHWPGGPPLLVVAPPLRRERCRCPERRDAASGFGVRRALAQMGPLLASVQEHETLLKSKLHWQLEPPEQEPQAPATSSAAAETPDRTLGKQPQPAAPSSPTAEGAVEAQRPASGSSSSGGAPLPEPHEVLAAVRRFAAAAQGQRGTSLAAVKARRELLRGADDGLRSLSALLQTSSLEVLIEVLELLADFECIEQEEMLERVAALILARHYQDEGALAGPAALRVAASLGRLAAAGRLSAEGGTAADAVRKLLWWVQQRIGAGAEQYDVGQILALGDNFLAELCLDAVAKALLIRMETSNLGAELATARHLPAVVRVMRAVRQKRSKAFLWSLPRSTREYIETAAATHVPAAARGEGHSI